MKDKESFNTIKAGNIDALVIANEKFLKVYTAEASDIPYRILIEKMNEGAATLNEAGTILYCNARFANMVKLPLQKVIGSEFKNYIDDTLKESFTSILKQSIKDGIKEEVFIYPNGGDVLPVLMSVNTFPLDDILVSSIILTDLTIQNNNQQDLRKANDKLHEKTQLLQQQEERLKMTNEDLLQLNQNLEIRVFERTAELENLNHELKKLNLSKDKFLSLISHDLRNPFSALMMSSDLLTIKTKDPGFQDIRSLVEIIGNTSRKILQQLNELLKWAKMQQEKISINPESIQLIRIVEESLELLKDIAIHKNVVLENIVPIDIYVNADKIMLRSILQNLVTNAIKYTLPTGSITVVAQRIEKMVEVSVIDTGIGMESNIMKTLFTNANYTSASGTNNEKGTGLGLILVKDFVTQLNGNIRVESKLRKGTSIIFTLPG